MNNRPIKFRAWEKTEGKMLDLAAMRMDAFLVCWYHDIIFKGKRSFKTGGKTYEYEVMQFTGLHDKNGKEIYEGDLVKREDHSTPFEVAVNYTSWRLKNVKSGWWWDWCGDLEVIGNIYENPELAK